MNSYVRCHHLPIFRHVLLDSVFCHQSTPLVASLAVGPTPPRPEPPSFYSEVRSLWRNTSVTIRLAIAASRSEIKGQLTRTPGNRSNRSNAVKLVGFPFIFMTFTSKPQQLIRYCVLSGKCLHVLIVYLFIVASVIKMSSSACMCYSSQSLKSSLLLSVHLLIKLKGTFFDTAVGPRSNFACA